MLDIEDFWVQRSLDEVVPAQAWRLFNPLKQLQDHTIFNEIAQACLSPESSGAPAARRWPVASLH